MADENNLEINIGINPAGAEAGARRTTAAVGSVVNEAKQMGDAFSRLKSALDPSYAAQQKYTKAVEEFDRQLKAGKLSQQEYAQSVAAVQRAFDAQVQSIQRNSAAAKRAAQENAVASLQEAAAREKSAADAKRIADEWLALERRNTQSLRSELQQRKVAQKAYIDEAVRAAREAAQARVAADRAGGATVTKGAEARIVADAARAAKQAARERVLAEDQANEEILASYQQTYQAAKALADEAAAGVKNAAQDRARAEAAVTQSSLAVEKAERREAAQVARQATAAASQAARERAAAEKQSTAATREQTRATEEAARAAKREADAVAELRASINPTYAAQQRYNDTMQKATQLLMANKLQTGEWTQIQKQARAQMELNQRSLGRMNAVSVQMGYQMQDVVASWASGISPLVILAQQGGQTASALSMLGGTTGRVAAFFAGPWGAAIMGAVMVLGFLWDANKKAETSTKDVMDAEDRRRMSVKELTEALREYTKAQREANQETLAGKIAEQQATADIRAENIRKYTVARERLTDLEKQLEEATNKGPSFGEDVTAYTARIATLTGQIFFAKRQVESLKEAYQDAMAANTQAAIATAQQIADMTELARRESEERTALTKAAERDYTAAQVAGKSAIELAGIQIKYQKDLQALKERYAKLQEEERKNTREQAKEEALYFKSREDAIQRLGNALIKRGYSERMENFGVGDKRVGHHPGMGREAHGKYAIDVNIPGAGVEANDPIYRKQMEAEVRAAQAAGYRVLWNGKIYEPHGGGPTRDIPKGKHQHRDHAHIEAPESIVGKPAGSQLAGQLENAQMQAIQDEHNALIADIDFKKELAGQELQIVLGLQDQKIAAQRAFYGAGSKEELDAMRERVRIQQRMDQQTLAETRRTIEHKLALETSAEERSFEMRQAARDRESDANEFLANQGLITEQEALLRRAQQLDMQFQDTVNHENRMFQAKVQSLRDQMNLENLTTEAKAALHRQIETMEAEHLGRMQALQNNYSRDVNRIQYDDMAQSLGRWREVSETFTSSMGSNLQQLWMRSTTVSQALLNMADQQVFKLMEMGQRWLQDWIMKQVQSLLVKKQTDAAILASTQATGVAEQGITSATAMAAQAAAGIKTAAAVEGAAAQTGAAAAAGTTEVTTNAAVAAAGAYKSTVVIPFIGPVAAPAAAALALAAVLGFASLISAKGGMGEVDKDQLAMVHKKEMILPAWIAEPLRQSLSTPSSSNMMLGASMAGAAARTAQSTYGDSFEFNYQPKHTNMGATMDQLLRQDGQRLRKWIKNEIRNGNIKGSSI